MENFPFHSRYKGQVGRDLLKCITFECPGANDPQPPSSALFVPSRFDLCPCWMISKLGFRKGDKRTSELETDLQITNPPAFKLYVNQVTAAHDGQIPHVLSDIRQLHTQFKINGYAGKYGYTYIHLIKYTMKKDCNIYLYF